VLFVDLFSNCIIITFPICFLFYNGTAFDNQSIFVGSNYAVAAVENKQPATLGGAPEVSSGAAYSAVDTGWRCPKHIVCIQFLRVNPQLLLLPPLLRCLEEPTRRVHVGSDVEIVVLLSYRRGAYGLRNVHNG